MLTTLFTATRTLLVVTLLTGVAYPASITGLAQVFLPFRANGSVVTLHDRAVGSELVGQAFTDARYVHGRPSATSPMPCNAAAGAGSNMGPSHPALRELAQQRAERWRVLHGAGAPVAVHAVSASGSGLDPHVPPAMALAQVPRVAAARGMPEEAVRDVVQRVVESPWAGLPGAARVNVLRVNLQLDAMQSAGAGR